MDISRKIEFDQLQKEKSELFDKSVLHILNGQVMYEEFKNNQLMRDSDYAPFNEAMCVNPTTDNVFDKEFITTRATGHRDTTEGYIEKVIGPLDNLFTKKYKSIVLWFGEDMFCQMNLLSILAYLEQSGYEGNVFLNSFKEDEFFLSHTEIALGHYETIYKDVLVNHAKPSNQLPPLMEQAVNIYLNMLNEDNAIVQYIKKNNDLSTPELVQRLFSQFPTVGYGDSQYIELINRTR
jgi:hypothetical protein